MGLREIEKQVACEGRDKVLSNAFGHLFPKKGKVYKGVLRVAGSCYEGRNVVLEEECGIDSSPWWYNAIHDFADSIEVECGQVKEVNFHARAVRGENGGQVINVYKDAERVVLTSLK